MNKFILGEKINKILNTCIIPNLEDSSQFYIYILKCESGKYYVGKTKDIRRRIEQHLIRKTCKWTEKFKPLEIEKIFITDDALDEDKWVKKYIMLQGLNNVRGGSYCQINLKKNQMECIIHEICHSRGRCFYCFADSHLVRVNYN